MMLVCLTNLRGTFSFGLIADDSENVSLDSEATDAISKSS